ncbi:MAG: hypothetical protein ACTSUX_07950 [Promethearchaeota archaeon]
MSKIEEADKGMRVMAIIGGIVALIESIMQIIGMGLFAYGMGLIAAIIALIFSFITIGLGIRPIRYTPFILIVLSIGLIILADLIGGIIVLLATFIGFLT